MWVSEAFKSPAVSPNTGLTVEFPENMAKPNGIQTNIQLSLKNQVMNLEPGMFTSTMAVA